MKLLWVGMFGLVGVFARYGIGYFFASKGSSGAFPFWTFAINLVGSFLIGVVYVTGIEKSLISPELRTGLIVGLLGGFTTFSAYSLESALLILGQNNGAAILYMFSSSILGLGLTLTGIYLTRLLV